MNLELSLLNKFLFNKCEKDALDVVERIVINVLITSAVANFC